MENLAMIADRREKRDSIAHQDCRFQVFCYLAIRWLHRGKEEESHSFQKRDLRSFKVFFIIKRLIAFVEMKNNTLFYVTKSK